MISWVTWDSWLSGIQCPQLPVLILCILFMEGESEYSVRDRDEESKPFKQCKTCLLDTALRRIANEKSPREKWLKVALDG